MSDQQQPQTGGSFIRQTDGSLVANPETPASDSTAADAPAAKPAAEVASQPMSEDIHANPTAEK
jgi:hypothetical protein